MTLQSEAPVPSRGAAQMEAIVQSIECEHKIVKEIGGDFDQDGRVIRLVRCQRCGLLIREYLARGNYSRS